MSLVRRKTLITFTILLLTLCASLSYAKELHVSIHGDDKNDGSLSSPLKSIQAGMKKITAGDTLYIHKGTYKVNGYDDYEPALEPNESGTKDKPITITTYGDGKVLIDGGQSPTNTIIGSTGKDYVHIKGSGPNDLLHIKGQVFFRNSQGCKLEFCDIYGGGQEAENWNTVLRIERSYDTTIRNNIIHDNWHSVGSALLQYYGFTDEKIGPLQNTIIEYNTFYNAENYAIRLKDDPEGVTIRNNYFYDCGGAGVRTSNQAKGQKVYIYQNIFRNCKYGVQFIILVDPVYVYNNNFINCKQADIRAQQSGEPDVVWHAFNNIHYKSNKYIETLWGPSIKDDCRFLDYNIYFSGKGWTDDGKTYETLTQWRKHLDSDNNIIYESNSITVNPEFNDPNGLSANSFKRKKYSKNGRGGQYPNVIGAFINDNTTIGFNYTGSVSLKAPVIIDVSNQLSKN